MVWNTYLGDKVFSWHGHAMPAICYVIMPYVVWPFSMHRRGQGASTRAEGECNTQHCSQNSEDPQVLGEGPLVGGGGGGPSKNVLSDPQELDNSQRILCTCPLAWWCSWVTFLQRMQAILAEPCWAFQSLSQCCKNFALGKPYFRESDPRHSSSCCWQFWESEECGPCFLILAIFVNIADVWFGAGDRHNTHTHTPFAEPFLYWQQVPSSSSVASILGSIMRTMCVELWYLLCACFSHIQSHEIGGSPSVSLWLASKRTVSSKRQHARTPSDVCAPLLRCQIGQCRQPGTPSGRLGPVMGQFEIAGCASISSPRSRVPAPKLLHTNPLTLHTNPLTPSDIFRDAGWLGCGILREWNNSSLGERNPKFVQSACSHNSHCDSTMRLTRSSPDSPENQGRTALPSRAVATCLQTWQASCVAELPSMLLSYETSAPHHSYRECSSVIFV